MNQVAKIEAEPQGRDVALSSAVTPMEMLAAAIEKGMTPDVIDKLMALEERWDKNKARKAFDVAIAEAKAEIPVIVKNREGHNSKRYADFAALARVIDPVLGKHGLAYRFRTQQNDRIQVTCVLSHKDGHFEENTLSGPPDATGSKNAIQAIGSTLSYLQRYSLIQALGLAASDDDDGKTADDGPVITDAQHDAIRDLIDQTKSNSEIFCKYFGISGTALLQQRDYQRAIDMLEAKKGPRA